MSEIDLLRTVAEPTVQECWFWFIPLLFLGAAATIAICSSGDNKIEEDVKTMSVLGMPASGKTIWWSYLEGKYSITNRQTARETKEFTLKVTESRYMTIKGVDIGGSRVYQRNYDPEGSEYILFFFDAKMYLNKIEYRRDVNGRLQYLGDHLGCNSLHLVLSHFDELKNPKKDCDEVIGMIRRDVNYRVIAHWMSANMTKRESCDELKKQVFEK